MRVAILTVSDSAAAGERADLSGPAVRRRCEDLGWRGVATEILRDEESLIAGRLESWVDDDAASLILTTGGTGVAARDVTPEATRRVLERELPGLGELMRARGLEQTKYAVLSRAVVGTRKRALIANLPGSTRGAVNALNAIEEVAQHVVDLLEGRTEHAG